MNKQLIFSLTLLILVVAGCGGQPTQTPPEAAVPTQAVPQPTPPAMPANIPTDTAAPAADTSTPATEAPVSSVSFANDVMPIFENSCNKCHGVEQVKEGLDMSTYEGLMTGSFNGPVLVAGNSVDSFLVQQVTKGEMPKRGPKLTPEQIQVISDWIDSGALNN
jgi:hypothetical protein